MDKHLESLHVGEVTGKQYKFIETLMYGKIKSEVSGLIAF